MPGPGTFAGSARENTGGREAAEVPLCVVPMFPSIFLWSWQIFRGPASSCGPVAGSWELTHQLLCPSRSASPGMSPHLLPFRALSRLFLLREPFPLAEGPTASPVRHSYPPSPASTAFGKQALWTTVIGTQLLGKCPPLALQLRPALPQCPFHPVPPRSGDTHIP